MDFQRYVCIYIYGRYMSIKVYIESILRKTKYIHGILNDTLKVYDMVCQKYFKRNITKNLNKYTYIYIWYLHFNQI